MKHDYINKRLLYLLGVVLILSLSGCRVAGGGVHIDWGNMPKETPHPEVQTKKDGPPPHAMDIEQNIVTNIILPAEFTLTFPERCIFILKEPNGGCPCPYLKTYT